MKVITGRQGAGKTAYLLAYAAKAGQEGRSVGGVAAPAVFEAGRRIGYDFIDLRRGTRQPLARVVDSPDDTPTVGPYRFVEDAVVAGNRAIIAGVRDGVDMVAIDEVGPLEFRGGGWAPALQVALAEGRQPQELVIVVRPALVADLSKLLVREKKLDFELIEIPDGGHLGSRS